MFLPGMYLLVQWKDATTDNKTGHISANFVLLTSLALQVKIKLKHRIKGALTFHLG